MAPGWRKRWPGVALLVSKRSMSTPKQPRAKLHHFVPQWYLRLWADSEERLWLYPMNGGNPWQAKPGAVAAETYLYRATPPQRPNEPIVADDTEEWFADWEGLFHGRWDRFAVSSADPASRIHFARFLATLYARHPDQRDAVRAMNARFLAEAADVPDGQDVEYIGPQGQLIQLSASEIRECAKTDRASVGNDFIRLMKTMTRTVADSIVRRKWGFYSGSGVTFATSDRPVALHRGQTLKPTFGFTTPGTLVTFPISPQQFLIISESHPRDCSLYEVEDDASYLEFIVDSAKRFVFASRRDDRIGRMIRRKLAHGADWRAQHRN